MPLECRHLGKYALLRYADEVTLRFIVIGIIVIVLTAGVLLRFQLLGHENQSNVPTGHRRGKDDILDGRFIVLGGCENKDAGKVVDLLKSEGIEGSMATDAFGSTIYVESEKAMSARILVKRDSIAKKYYFGFWKGPDGLTR